MARRMVDADTILNRAKPLTHQHAHEIQPCGHIVRLPIAVAENVRQESWFVAEHVVEMPLVQAV